MSVWTDNPDNLLFSSTLISFCLLCHLTVEISDIKFACNVSLCAPSPTANQMFTQQAQIGSLWAHQKNMTFLNYWLGHVPTIQLNLHACRLLLQVVLPFSLLSCRPYSLSYSKHAKSTHEITNNDNK